MSIESVIPSNHLVLSYPFLLLPSIFLSIRVFSNESALHVRWPKYWSFSFNISPSNDYSGLISWIFIDIMIKNPEYKNIRKSGNPISWFPDQTRMDWLDLLAVQGTLKSLLQHRISKASTLQCSAFFIVQLSHPYMTTGKTMALTTWASVSKVMSLFFNALSRFVIAFLPRNKYLLISWLYSHHWQWFWSPPQKSLSLFQTSFSIYLPWSHGTRCHDLHFLNVEF